MTVAVIDGMGGGIGEQIVSQLRKNLPEELVIIALGTNAIATDRMIRAHASCGASGENAIRININKADFIIGPIGIVLPNSMMGEISPFIAENVMNAPGRKLLIPLSQRHIEIIGLAEKSVADLISLAIEKLKSNI
ncbi:MAG: DUF3842 family protein [Brevinematales bacterium]|jgi:hypothetical protein